MTSARQALGRLGEDLAVRELVAHGCKLVERNARTPAGEIDLVARHGLWWVFVEVRCRRGSRYGRPEDSLTPRKRAHMLAAAEAYVCAHHLDGESWRIDLVSVELSGSGQLMRVEWIPDALNH